MNTTLAGMFGFLAGCVVSTLWVAHILYRAKGEPKPIVLTTLTLVIFATFLFGMSKCEAADDWSRADTARELTFQVANVLDALQTNRIQYRADLVEGDRFTKAMIGSDPNSRDVALYFGTLAISHYIIARSLPKSWRPWYQGATVAYTSYNVTNNCTRHGLCW